MIKKIFAALFLVLFATSMMAQSGLTCEDAIPVDSNYVGSIAKPGTYWFSAGTYDLPLNVHFVPNNFSTSKAPELVIDVTCTPGQYDDPLVDSLINMVEAFDITFPVEMRLESAGDEYDMFIDAMYREQMAKFGVTYNVPAFVKVTFFDAGEVSFKPDTVFTACLNNDTVQLGDTLTILANDVDRAVLMPYTDWQEDSIQFVWTGSEPATIYMASGKCDFTPALGGYVWAAYEVQPNEPYRLSNKAIRDAVAQNDGGGIFYAKIISASAGKMVTEIIPMAAAQGGAIMLEYGQPITLSANDNTLYCFLKSWTSTQFVSTSATIAKAYFSNTSEFTASDEDAAVLKARTFGKIGNSYELSLSSTEMSAITKKATDDYIYVRFQCAKPTTITPWAWDASDCADKSTIIESEQKFSVASRSGNTIYRLLYDDWKGGDLTIKWSGSSSIPTYVADTCAFTLASNNSHVVLYSNISKRSSRTFAADVVDSWASRVDADGFLYVRMNPTAEGNVTFTSIKPEPEEPEIPEVPVDSALLNTVELKVGDNLNVALDSVFTIYRINYAEWLSTGATLTWTGSEPLHVFVAENYQFAVAPYNKYVHAYVPVPAGGGVVFDKNMLEALKDKVGENGYLYVRLLTEFPGNLSVK